MKKIILFLLPVFIAGMTGCSKDDSTTTPTNPAGPTPFTPTVANVNGALIAIQMDYSYSNPQIPIPVTISSDIGLGVFYSTPGASTFVDAGAVSVNTIALDKQSNNSYMKMATIGQTPADLGLSGGVDWSVAGAGSIPAITYSHAGAFPSYTDSLPAVITKANGLTLDISSASNADSIYVMIAAGNQSVFKRFAGNATTATITSSELSALPNVSDNTAFLEVLPTRFKLETIGGKDFVFIKERAVVRGININ